MSIASIEITGQAEPVSLLHPTGGGLLPHPVFSSYVRDIGDAELVQMYTDLVVVRRIDAEATALQRQGELGLWAPMLGQEAAQVGSARALRGGDFVFASYREHAVAYLRGVDPTMILRFWRGSTHSGWNPYEVNMTTPAIVVGSQMLQAVGYGMGIRRDRSDDIAITYFGDGATSQGDFSEALGFAASFNAPVVFFCQNNQFAISAPVGVQSTVPIVQRAAVTYRMGPHTTSDDPTRYRDADELARWRERDPIDRLLRTLEHRGIATPEMLASAEAKASEFAASVRAGCLGTVEPAPESIFENVYTEPHALLEEERAEFLAYHGIPDPRLSASPESDR